jgi:hypothetical protein
MRMAATEAQSAALSIKFTAATRTMDGLKSSIGEMFDEVGCNTAATRELLGDGGVTDSSVLQYLALIEQRCEEIVSLFLSRLARMPPMPSVQAEPSETRSSFTIRTDYTQQASSCRGASGCRCQAYNAMHRGPSTYHQARSTLNRRQQPMTSRIAQTMRARAKTNVL